MDTCVQPTMRFTPYVSYQSSAVSRRLKRSIQLIGKAAERIEREFAPDLFVAIGMLLNLLILIVHLYLYRWRVSILMLTFHPA